MYLFYFILFFLRKTPPYAISSQLYCQFTLDYSIIIYSLYSYKHICTYSYQRTRCNTIIYSVHIKQRILER